MTRLINQLIYDKFFLISLGIHFGVLLLGGLGSYILNYETEPKIVTFRVIEKPKKSKDAAKKMVRRLKSKAIEIKKKKVKKKKIKKKVNKVFGASRKTLRSTSKDALIVKSGNTVAKKLDQKVLKKDDLDSLPIPEEEYLVTQMPRVKKEYRPSYPTEAKNKNIQGRVILEILIDAKGKVRTADLIEGLGYGLDEAAIEAIYQFEFEPARIDSNFVAVKIRYAVNFVLEK